MPRITTVGPRRLALGWRQHFHHPGQRIYVMPRASYKRDPMCRQAWYGWAPSTAVTSSVFMFPLPRDKGGQRLQSTVHVDLDGGLGNSTSDCCFYHAQSVDLYVLNGDPHFFRQTSQ